MRLSSNLSEKSQLPKAGALADTGQLAPGITVDQEAAVLYHVECVSCTMEDCIWDAVCWPSYATEVVLCVWCK